MTMHQGADFWRSSLDPQRVMNVKVTHWQENEHQQREDHVTVEEPFEIRISSVGASAEQSGAHFNPSSPAPMYRPLAAIMRTPGNDSELAMGFLFTEGVIHNSGNVQAIEDAVDADGLPLANVVNVLLRDDTPDGDQLMESTTDAPVPVERAQFERHFAVSASCGLCGKNSIEDVMIATPPLEIENLRIPATCIYDLPEQLRTSQAVFTHTGGLHAAALFTSEGELLLVREDVGRHNAVDKIIGHGLLHGNFPYSRHILMVSGRTSFEIIQKALLARIPCVAAISAPSSLAVEFADSAGITLIGFLRGRSMNVYTHPERIV